MKDFMTPPNHEKFLAKKLFNENGKIQWGAIAYIEKDGGGPAGNHTHSDNHIFIVVEGEVRVIMGNETVIVKKNESCFVACKILGFIEILHKQLHYHVNLLLWTFPILC